LSKRKIISIDENKCNGCAACIPNCPEGAIQIIDGKARLVSDLFCDGLGACLGHCPLGAISIEEREAESYSERKVMENIVKQGPNVIKAHLQHLKDHNEVEYLRQAQAVLEEGQNKIASSSGALGSGTPRNDGTTDYPNLHNDGKAGSPCACPGSKVIDLRKPQGTTKADKAQVTQESQLENWPVQIMLVPPHAPYFEGADLLIAADCVPFAYARFHEDLLRGKVLLAGCPKLDNTDLYREKFNQIFKDNNINSITYAHMEVPCCFGLIEVIKTAIANSGKKIPFQEAVIGIKGERIK
jgi:Pyruvate/2-oxoacid:ferredoxin oxidoreductase delta subunit